MASWLIPALRAVLPHVGTIISAASPVFTKKRMGAAADQNALLQEQIAELQGAVSQNASNIRELAAELEGTVLTMQAGLKRATILCVAALALSVVALGVALFVVLR